MNGLCFVRCLDASALLRNAPRKAPACHVPGRMHHTAFNRSERHSPDPQPHKQAEHEHDIDLIIAPGMDCNSVNADSSTVLVGM